jgi:hypothetical protein
VSLHNEIWDAARDSTLQYALKVLDEAETLEEARIRIRYVLEAMTTSVD